MPRDESTAATESDGFGQEVVYRVRKTRNGAKVVKYDGRGLADGYMSKNNLRYWTDEDAEEAAHRYARKKADDHPEGRFVGLGETW